jgi:hypothetical protein
LELVKPVVIASYIENHPMAAPTTVEVNETRSPKQSGGHVEGNRLDGTSNNH